MANGSAGIAYVKAVEMPACVGTGFLPALRAASASSQVANTAVSQTATLSVTVAPGLKPAKLAIEPGPPGAAGFQVPGKVVFASRKGAGTNDWVRPASEAP